MPSAHPLGVTVVHAHAATLAQARNAGLAEVHTTWTIHLDADVELEAGYLDAMAEGTADVRAPAVRYIRGGHATWPAVPKVAGHTHDCVADCLPSGNWLVVGACVRTELISSVGWHDFAWSEDWAAWLACYKAGATFEAIPSAIYRAHTRPGSRNRAIGPTIRNRVHHEILASVYPEGAPLP